MNKQRWVNLNIEYQLRNSNKPAYEKCSIITIGSQVQKRQWELLGHVFWMDGNMPAQKTVIQCFTTSRENNFRRRKRTTIISITITDILRRTERSPREWRAEKLLDTMCDFIQNTKQAKDRDGRYFSFFRSSVFCRDQVMFSTFWITD